VACPGFGEFLCFAGDTAVQKNIVAAFLVVVTSFTAAPARSADNCAAVLKSMNAEVAQKAYSIRSTDQNPDSGKVTSSNVAEVQPPDRMHLINGADETIVIRGKGTFRKSNNGGWEKAPYDLSDAMLSFYDPKNFEKFSKDCKRITTEKLDGHPMSVWQFRSESPGIVSISKLWISDSDGLPYKMEIDGEVAKHKTRTVQLIQYDPKISIQAPIR